MSPTDRHAMATSATMNAEQVAQFASDLSYATLPPEVEARLRLALLDTLGCWIAGRRQASARLAQRAARRGAAASSSWARALTGGVAASALDFDDGHYEGGGTHLGSIVVPALLSVASCTTRLDSLLAAMAAGYEVAIRAGYLLAPRTPQDPYHASGAPGCLGAAVAVAKLLGLDCGGIHRALRLASAQRPQAQLQLPMVKESIGWGCATAVMSAELAAEGFDDVRDALCVPPVLSLPATPFDTPLAREDAFVALPGNWHLQRAYCKPYACCRAFHAALDALRAIMDESHWTAQDIDAVDVETLSAAVTLDYLPPASVEHAQFSFPYALGCLAVHGAVGPAQMCAAALTDASVLDFARRVRLQGSTQLDALGTRDGYPAIVTVRAGHRSIRRTARGAVGGPTLPWTAAQVADKFLRNVAGATAQGTEWLAQLLAPTRLPEELLELLHSEIGLAG